MNEFTIRFIGIVMFLTVPIGNVPNARHVVLPRWDETASIATGAPTAEPEQLDVQNVEAHVPYLAFTTEACDSGSCAELSGWPDGAAQPFFRDGKQWIYLPITGHHLTVLDSRNKLSVKPTVAQLMPRIRDYCDDFILPEEFRDDTRRHGRKAATIDITTGILNSLGDIAQNKAVITQWNVTVPDELVIVAKPYGGGPEKRVELTHSPVMQVEIGNAPDGFIRTGKADHTTHNHFLVYYAASQNAATANVRGTSALRSRCSAKPGPHGDVADAGASGDRLPSADCSNTNYP